MSGTKPGADEPRMRAILRKRGVGPDAEPAYDWWQPQQPPPSADTEPTDTEPDEEEQPDNDDEPSKPPVFAPQPGYYPQPHMPAAVDRARGQIALSPRTRKLLYNASAAGTGWALGLYHQFAAAIADCGHQTGTSGGLALGVGGSLLIAHVWDRRTRHWWPPIAWCARIPLATALLALLLWAPGS